MKSYVNSIVAHVVAQIEHQAIGGHGRLQFVIPSLGGAAACELAKLLENICFDRGLRLIYKVSPGLVNSWQQELRDCLERKYLAEESLTNYRNRLSGDDVLIQVLVGSAYIDDKSSLADFHQCDDEVLWHQQLKKSFVSWIEPRLSAQGFGDNGLSVKRIDEIFCVLHELHHLIDLSNLLDSVDFSMHPDRQSPEQEVLSQLGTLKLPNLGSFTFGNQRRNLPYYVEQASGFFSWESFSETKKRKTALKNVDGYFDANAGSVPMAVYSEGFGGEDQFKSALRKFIECGVADTSLARCDFIYILEKILKSQPKAPTDKATVRKLSGSPVEVVLNALWFALGQRDSKADIAKIVLLGRQFRHDFVGGDLVSTATSIDEAAKKHLLRLIGGLDELCQKHIKLSQSCSNGEVVIESNLLNDDLAYRGHQSAEPYFQFSIDVHDVDDGVDSMAFAWKLPEIHPYRLAEGLIGLANVAYERNQETWILPAFNLPYYSELMACKDEDEVCRVLSHCLRAGADGGEEFMVNLFRHEWQRPEDPFVPHIQNVCGSYGAFIRDAGERGILAALRLGESIDLFDKYKDAARAFSQSDSAARDGTKLAAMLTRAFMVISSKKGEDPNRWAVAKFERSGIVTVLHPALLEMLQSQIAFQFEAFSNVASEAIGASSKFDRARWQYFVDMSAMQMPLSGLLVDEDLRLDVSVTGRELVHRYGRISPDDSPISTRLLTRYDAVDDEDISDSEMFRETRESKLLFRLLREYWYMHPHASDGISLGIFRNDDIQPVLSAVHQYLECLADKKILNEDKASRYLVRLVFFSNAVDDSAIVNWLEQWQERWEAAESEGRLRWYRYCRLEVARRLVGSENCNRHLKEILESEGDFDIFVFHNFIEAGRKGNKFRRVGNFNETKDTLKFPILEKSLCASSEPDEVLRRAQVISNRQFRIGALHTDLMARLCDRENGEYVVLGHGDYGPWKAAVDAAHKASEWVVCVDPNIDEWLIGEKSEAVERRELIGFGTGVGSHGESNYTISTQKFFLNDLGRILRAQFAKVFRYGSCPDDEMIADELLDSAKLLAGISLIRALGPDQYIRDFIAYSLVRRILPLSKGFICDQLFSIDAYRHWFDMTSDEDESRPDLLWLRVSITEESRLSLQARLFECKVADSNQEHVNKAKTQIEHGLKVLVNAFRPRSGVLTDDRPDQRYWYLQLHRLISSRARIGNSDDSAFLEAMEKLAEGDFDITWDAAVFTFWTDTEGAGLKTSEVFEVQVGDMDLSVPVYAGGYSFVRDICAGRINAPTDWQQGIELSPGGGVVSEPLVERVPSPAELDDSVSGELWATEDVADEEASVVNPVPPTPTEICDHQVDLCVEGRVGAVESVSQEQGCSSGSEVVTSGCVQIPDRILLGKTVNGQRDIYWEFGHPKLTNRHLLIFGASGSGKTYAIQAILNELGRKGQNSLIVDYTNGFLSRQLEKVTRLSLKPKQYVLKNEKLPLNPFRRYKQEVDDNCVITDTPVDVAKRVAAILSTVYELGDQQFSVLMDAIESGVKSRGDKLTLQDVMAVLSGFLNDGEHPKNPVQTTISKLRPFVSGEPFSAVENGYSWDELFDDATNHSHVFQLTAMDPITQRAVTEFILWDLYAHARGHGSVNKPKVLVLDEIQNLDHGIDAPVGKILTEGRKFGLSLISATQNLSSLGSDEQDRIFQSAHKLFFRPAERENDSFAKFAALAAGRGDRNKWSGELMSLSRGECLSIGPVRNDSDGSIRNEVFKIRITALEDRGFDCGTDQS